MFTEKRKVDGSTPPLTTHTLRPAKTPLHLREQVEAAFFVFRLATAESGSWRLAVRKAELGRVRIMARAAERHLSGRAGTGLE
jgi:hypothetical protein